MNSVVSLYRYPVKGLRPESLIHASLSLAHGITGDRAFAFQFLDDTVPDELKNCAADRAPWMFKGHLAVQHDWPDMARIAASWDPPTRALTLKFYEANQTLLNSVCDSVETSLGRQALADALLAFLRAHKPFKNSRHPQTSPLRLIGAADGSTRYTDSGGAPVSLALRSSILDLGAKCSCSPLDERRFRLNLILEGAPSWTELTWTGRRLKIGECVLQVHKPIGRCPNIDVDQETGERRDEVFPLMKSYLGHSLTGMRADVVKAGEITVGDAWELLD